MAKILLLADSNIANNLHHQAVIGKGQYDFKKCTTKGLFINKLLAAQADLIVVAGIDCIVNEALTSPRVSERCVSLVLNNLVAKIAEKLEDESSGSGNLMVALASPLYWDDFHEDVKKSIQNTFKQLRKDWKQKIKFLPPCPGMKFLADRIHLDELSGVRYANHVIKKSCNLVKIIPVQAMNPSWADDVELQEMEDEEMEQDDSQPPISTQAPLRTASTATLPHQVPAITMQPNQIPQFSYPAPPSHQHSILSQPFAQVLSLPPQGFSNQELMAKYDQLAKRVDLVEDKAYYDNLTFAAIKEDQDDAANQRNLNRVTITGVKIVDFHKFAEHEKPAAMKAAVNKIIEKVTEEADIGNRTVVFTRHRNGHIRNAKSVVIEARFQDDKQAVAFRKDFVAKYKALKAADQLPSELEGVATFPVQTVATRVRAALLMAMARVVCDVTGPNISAYCQQYLTRPILKISNKSGEHTTTQTFGFVDSILKLKSNDDLRKVALDEAYQRAGSNFRGRLEQHFVILKDH